MYKDSPKVKIKRYYSALYTEKKKKNLQNEFFVINSP